jgi:hypothetical protein
MLPREKLDGRVSCPRGQAQARSGRWGDGLTAEKIKDCVWVLPELVADAEFVEWTPDNHPRHARFVGLKDR